MSSNSYAAVDLGAESGRVVLGYLAGGRMEMRDVHRFANVPVNLPDGLHWDLPRLYSEILVGLRAVVHEAPSSHSLRGIGIDSWAVDYGLMDRSGRLLGLPYHYRDSRTDGVAERVAELIPADEQYSRTGIAQLSFNTLYQLVAQAEASDPLLPLADTLLMVPDLLHYWLTGEKAMEYTNASSSGVLGLNLEWDRQMLERLELPAGLLQTPASPGTVLGSLRPVVARECNAAAAMVILPATHDTASAVAAVPFEPGRPSAYLSSGTWSLLGVERSSPILTSEARTAGFTNERGVNGSYRFLTNIMGLWVLQECRRSWARAGRNWEYADLMAAASQIASPGVLIDVADPAFLHPADMVEAVEAQLRQSGQPLPEDEIQLTRAILEGLALAYMRALQQMTALGAGKIEQLHIVGGGARNTLLCQLTADACQIPVLAGPLEATALGNLLVQAMACGEINSISEARDIVRASATPLRYDPHATGLWRERAEQLSRLRQQRGV